MDPILFLSRPLSSSLLPLWHKLDLGWFPRVLLFFVFSFLWHSDSQSYLVMFHLNDSIFKSSSTETEIYILSQYTQVQVSHFWLSFPLLELLIHLLLILEKQGFWLYAPFVYLLSVRLWGVLSFHILLANLLLLGTQIRSLKKFSVLPDILASS